MRITNNTLVNQIRNQLTNNALALMRAQEQVATGKKINRLSDDPVNGGRVLDLKSAISRTRQYSDSIGRATSLTTIQDQTLGQAGNLIGRAKELLLGESNEVGSTSATRESARIEIAMLTSQMVQLGNTRYDGNYIFSGFATTTPAFADATINAAPLARTGDATVTGSQVEDATKLTFDNYEIRFTAPGQFDVVNVTSGQTALSGQTYASGQPIRFDGIAVTLTSGPLGPATGDVYGVSATTPGTYQGDGQVQYVEIQQGQRVQQNTPGDRVFQGTGTAGGVNIFQTLNDINKALASNDRAAMSQLLDKLDAAQTQLSNERSQVGARANLLSQVKDRQGEIQMQLDTVRSNLEDADLAEAIIELNKQQTGYQATIGAAAKIIQPSLLDFLK